jgi:hypothetical protein
LNFAARINATLQTQAPPLIVRGAFYFTHMSFAAPQYLSAFGPKRTKVDFGLRWFVRFWTKATLAVHCGNVFDVGFSTYQSARLI